MSASNPPQDESLASIMPNRLIPSAKTASINGEGEARGEAAASESSGIQTLPSALVIPVRLTRQPSLS